jgi:hypothetical protein
VPGYSLLERKICGFIFQPLEKRYRDDFNMSDKRNGYLGDVEKWVYPIPGESRLKTGAFWMVFGVWKNAELSK